MGLIKKLKLRRWEKWGLTLLILFILGCIGLKLFIDYGIGDPKLTVKANDIKRLISSEMFSDSVNINSPFYVDKVEITGQDSITPSGTNFYKFRYRIRSEAYGTSWHEGSVEEKDMEFSNLRYR